MYYMNGAIPRSLLFQFYCPKTHEKKLIQKVIPTYNFTVNLIFCTKNFFKLNCVGLGYKFLFVLIQVGNNRGDCGLVNDVVTEDFQQHEGHVIASPAQQQSQVQQPQSQSGPAGTSAAASGKFSAELRKLEFSDF